MIGWARKFKGKKIGGNRLSLDLPTLSPSMHMKH